MSEFTPMGPGDDCRVFKVHRLGDVSGTSGTGDVALGLTLGRSTSPTATGWCWAMNEVYARLLHEVYEMALLHEVYEMAARESGWETQEASRVPWDRVPWDDVPPENQAATRAAANVVAFAERAAIVAWLRDQGWRALSDSADYIERGEHLRGHDE